MRPDARFARSGSFAAQDIGDHDAGRNVREAFLKWEQGAAIKAGGMTIGSDSHTHHSMDKLGLDDVRTQGRQLKRLLETHPGSPATSCGSPYGMRNCESAAAASVLAERGYG